MIKADLTSSTRSAHIPGYQRKRRLLRNHESIIYWLQLAVDIAIVSSTLLFFAWLKTDDIAIHWQMLAVISSLMLFVIYGARGVYRRASTYFSGCGRLTIAWLFLLSLLAILGYISKSSEVFSRQVLISWAATAFMMQIVAFCCFKFFSTRYAEKFARTIPALIVGEGHLARHLEKSITSNRWMPDRVVGFVRGQDDYMSDEDRAKLPKPVLGGLQALRILIKENQIRRVYVALPINASTQIESLHIDLLDMNVDVIWVPDIFALQLLNHSVREVAGLPLIYLNESPLTSTRGASFMKAAMDKALSLVALILLSPLLIGTAIAVKLSSPGPIIFKQKRHGWDGKVIEVWKFRSMKMHEESQGEVKQATQNDDRITRVGRFIRRTSIDELPQIINVLQGRMSLVGPRPHAVAHNDYYSDKINAYLSRHRIKPGITGLAQISGYRGETETLDKMAKRVEFDLAYINNWSLLLDIKIILKTPFTLFGKHIY